MRKLLLNLGPRAMRALGVVQYTRYFLVVLRSLPDVARTRGLIAVDRRMGRWVARLRFLGQDVRIDCPTVDAIVADGTYTFGIVRELVIRNCYIRNGVEGLLMNAQWVVDLGSNRGVFSALAAACGARNILAVEGLAHLAPAIDASMRAMRFDRYSIEPVFVGSRLNGEPPPGTTKPLAELLDRHGIERIDVLKMDIEGSEFGLFKEEGWLERVGSLCMEVHPEFGRVDEVLERLTEAGFDWRCGDHMFRVPPDRQRAEFIWAVRRGT